jgi:hypothetical protein
VEDNDVEYECRGMASIACTRCIEAINTWYREEIRLLLLIEFVVVVVVKGDSCVKKEESAIAELHRRGSVQ